MRVGVVAAVLGLLLAGCGAREYNASKLEQNIRTKLDQHRGFQVQSVKCPTDAKLATGVVINCTATLAGGHTVAVRNTQLDNKGTVHMVINEMFADNVANAIVAKLTGPGTAIAACPEHVPVVIGRQFRCGVTYRSGRHSSVIVTIVDADGGFRMRFG
jgi:hypothetical protein